MDIASMIWPTADLKAIAHVLDTSGHEARLRAVVELRGRDMARLFEAAAQSEPTTLEDFVPASLPPMAPVIHHGKNSLLAFTRFQKRFCRPPSGEASAQLWGYNEQELQPVTGPGYFVAHPAEEGGIVIDYTMLPPTHPAGWPPILPNSARLSRFIYNGTKDFMRRLSTHVTIGRARKGRNDMKAWFVLVREDPASQ